MLWTMDGNYNSKRIETSIQVATTIRGNDESSSYSSSSSSDEYNYSQRSNSKNNKSTTKKKRTKVEGANNVSSQSNDRILKHKRRYCREPGCDRIVKSQGLCQRHGAKPKKCRIVDCCKQAQGSYMGMCKSHYRLSQVKNQSTGSGSDNLPTTSLQLSALEYDGPTLIQFCKPIVSTAEDDDASAFRWTGSCAQTREHGGDNSRPTHRNWDPAIFGSTEALAEDIAILDSALSSNTVSGYASNLSKMNSSARPCNQQGLRTVKRGEVSPICDTILEKPHRVVRWSTVELMTSGDGKVMHQDGIPLELYLTDSTTNSIDVDGKFSSLNLGHESRDDLVLQRPTSISKRNFSTETNFTIDENMIDQDLDCEHAFDNVFDTNDSTNQDSGATNNRNGHLLPGHVISTTFADVKGI